MSLRSRVFDSKKFLASASTQAGIYKMLDANGKIIYVGKAKNLKLRLNSYFQDHHPSSKTSVLVSRIADIHCIITQTENEALLLEQTLIKEYRPRYNILLRDDKSYPSLYLSEHTFPNLRLTRSRKQRKGRYFGPYSKVGAVKETLELIQKFFKLRSCEDVFFANRSRPCLQYQIKRCKAPCVSFISQEEYAQDVQNAVLFLEGKNSVIIDSLTRQMQLAADQKEFEKALEFRDQIYALQSIMQKQYVVGLEQDKNFDVVFALIANGVGLVQKLLIRQGNLIDNKAHIISLPQEMQVGEILDAFLAQHYLSFEEIPSFIYVNQESSEHAVLAAVLTEKKSQTISIKQPKRGEKTQWLDLARVNALQTLEQHQAKHANYERRFADLQEVLQPYCVMPAKAGIQVETQSSELKTPREELVLDPASQLLGNLICFDISHTMGEATVASCVVFNKEGPDKESYRRFNIKDITGGDDYAAMRQVLMRYYESSVMPAKTGIQESFTEIVASSPGCQPSLVRQTKNILIIDGGKGQLTQAEKIVENIKGEKPLLLGIAKGEGRKSGLETIFLNSKGAVLDMATHPLAFLLLQEIRDEAHRFAITGHRNKRDKKRRSSTLESIAGIGPVRRQQLLAHFGGLQGLKQATVEQIAKVPGISQALAKTILESITAVSKN